jgi:hypothetical protein
MWHNAVWRGSIGGSFEGVSARWVEWATADLLAAGCSEPRQDDQIAKTKLTGELLAKPDQGLGPS